MNQQVTDCLAKYPAQIVHLFDELRQLVLCSAQTTPMESLWAKMPTYSVGNAFVRLIPFKDHINIEAKAVLNNAHLLGSYKVTPKGMLQIFVGQPIPTDTLCKIFAETFA